MLWKLIVDLLQLQRNRSRMELKTCDWFSLEIEALVSADKLPNVRLIKRHNNDTRPQL